MERRTVLKLATGALGSLVGAAMAVPVLGPLLHPLRNRVQLNGPRSLPVVDLDRLSDGVPLRARVVARDRQDAWARVERAVLGAVWLIRRGERVTALSTACPHAGCFVDYEQQAQRFVCPCHASAFDLDGKVLAGPSPRAMDALPCEVKRGQVVVAFQRFRAGARTQEPL